MTGAENYNVLYANSSFGTRAGTFSNTFTGDGETTTSTIGSLTTGTMYFVKVVPIDIDNNSMEDLASEWTEFTTTA